MKVLYYNWTPLGNSGPGGGVAIYMKALLSHIISHPQYGIEPVFLSSGYYYDSSDDCYLRRENDTIPNVKEYAIVNSPVIAPIAMMVSKIKSIKEDEVTKQQFDLLLQKEGPFDVIHLESFEGISPNVLSLKEKYPTVKFVHSIHDYGIICPNVRLWTINNKNCYLCQDKPQCKQCMQYLLQYCPSYFKGLRPKEANGIPANPSLLFKARHKIIRQIKKLSGMTYLASEKSFQEYRRYHIDVINRYSDAELCVSARVAEIIEAAGISPSKIVIDYIGTKVAEQANYECRTTPCGSSLTILFMGYGNIEKGIYCLLDAIGKIGEDMGKHIVLKLASKINDDALQKRINSLRCRLKDIIVYNGYTHQDFPEIFGDVNLGVVPPLWEDNLPQVAIEMIANGIPVLASQNGGAHELNSHPSFAFNGTDELKSKIVDIFNNRHLLEEYWSYSQKLTTMDTHINNLVKLYCQ